MWSKRRRGWLVLFVTPILLLLLFYAILTPDVSVWKNENPKKTAFMEYREREWKKEGKKISLRYLWVPFKDISPYLVQAVLIAEDDKFWRHEGFDLEAIRLAIEKDLKAKRLKFGGSTISQQLARNLYLSPEKSLLRKVREALITWKLEKTLSKRRILELYLNVVEWGEGIFGIEAASKHYYRKPASQLTPFEAARLAAILPNPKRYLPFSDHGFVATRANDIYHTMIRRGIIPSESQEGLEEIEPPLDGEADSEEAN